MNTVLLYSIHQGEACDKRRRHPKKKVGRKGMHDDQHVRETRVTKKLNAGQPGTKRALKRYGNALVCVRYRHDPMKLYRFTTVEIVLDHAPIHPRQFDRATFGMDTARNEHELRRTLKAAGARWDPNERIWWLRGDKIRKLGLVHRITKT